ncbi:hypothetical protein [Micromonospora sediminicola]|nr:hypothetical protein [Micromonospora sediminicola]
MTEDDRAAIGKLVERHRAALRLAVETVAARAPMSAVTWTRVEKGLPVRLGTYGGVETAFGWAPGAVLRFLDTGEDPQDVQPAPRVPRDLVQEVLDLDCKDAVKVLLVRAVRSGSKPVDAVLDSDAPDGDKVAAIRALRELKLTVGEQQAPEDVRPAKPA